MGNPKQYETKVERVKAYKVEQDQLEEIADWCNGMVYPGGYILFPTLAGNVRVEIGEYVVKDPHLGFYMMNEQVFNAKFHQSGLRTEPDGKSTRAPNAFSDNGWPRV